MGRQCTYLWRKKWNGYVNTESIKVTTRIWRKLCCPEEKAGRVYMMAGYNNLTHALNSDKTEKPLAWKKNKRASSFPFGQWLEVLVTFRIEIFFKTQRRIKSRLANHACELIYRQFLKEALRVKINFVLVKMVVFPRLT
jgi:hypothetical protein